MYYAKHMFCMANFFELDLLKIMLIKRKETNG